MVAGAIKPPLYQKNIINPKDVSTTSLRDDEDCNVFYAYKPMNILQQLLGMQKVTYSDGKFLAVGIIVKLYSLLLSLAVLVFSVYSFKGLQERESPTLSVLIVIIDMLSNVCSAMTAIISMLLTTILCSPFFVRALQRFNNIDRQLGIHGIDNYSFLRKRILIIETLFLIVTLIHFAYEYSVGVKLWKNDYRLIPMHILDMSINSGLIDFAVVVWIIVTRLKMFNEQLSQLLQDCINAEELKSSPVDMLSDEFKHVNMPNLKLKGTVMENAGDEKIDTLTRLMKIYDEVADVVYIVSSCYGLLLLFTSTLTFLYILSTINGLIMFDELVQEDKHHTVLYVVGWSLPSIIYIVIAAWASEMIKSEVVKTNDCVDKLSINTELGTKQDELLENFSQLLSAREVFITASNCFPFDFTFIISLIGAVATYSVILIQVKKTATVPGGMNETISNFTNYTKQ